MRRLDPLEEGREVVWTCLETRVRLERGRIWDSGVEDSQLLLRDVFLCLFRLRERL